MISLESIVCEMLGMSLSQPWSLQNAVRQWILGQSDYFQETKMYTTNYYPLSCTEHYLHTMLCCLSTQEQMSKHLDNLIKAQTHFIAVKNI